MVTGCEYFELGDIDLQSGMKLRGAKLTYKTYGQLNSKRNNVIVFPTFYAGKHADNEPMVGSGMALDPDKYFIIVPNLLGNGLSSSPSNMAPPYDRAGFPEITYYDNVMCQHRLITEYFGIEQIALVCGFSMGAQQAYHWGALFPDTVERIAPWCGSARTSLHNFVFLEGIKAALCADEAWQDGYYEQQPTKGIKAMARVYAGWGPSQAFYREKLYLKMGASSLEDFLLSVWEGSFLQWDANDLLAMLSTWQSGDVSNNPNYKGDFVKALGSIKAKALIMPSRTDQYFPTEDNEIEVGHMPNAELSPIPSDWGHMAGLPGCNPADTQFIDLKLKALLAR